MLDSMFGSMTTSLQLAQECLKHNSEGEQQADSAQPFEGLEMFAQTIEAGQSLSTLCQDLRSGNLNVVLYKV